MRGIVYKIGLLLALLAGGAQAEPLQPLHFNGQYIFTWNGLMLGGLTFGIEETATDYRLHLNVASQGLVNIFTRHSDDTVAAGVRQNGRYLPIHYESFYKTKGKPRHLLVDFDNNGTVTQEVNEPPDKTGERPPVPHALKDGAYDPLTLLMALRAGVTDTRGFDARRVFEVKAVKGAGEPQQAGSATIAAFPLTLTRLPLAGLTAKETAAYAKGEPALRLYFSDDVRRIPVSVDVPLFFGHVHGALIKECAAWDECKIP